MGNNTGIQWTEATWNPWVGCIKVSAGCKFCYMYRDQERWGKDPRVVTRTSVKTFNSPLQWKEPKIIFTCSWSDWFIPGADKWRAEAWKIIRDTPQHTYQILTKRPELIRDRLPADWGDGYPNVWLGISAEDQENYMKRMADFIPVKAKVKFLSAEPLLGRIVLDSKINVGGGITNGIKHLNWVIIGGESGHGKEPEDKNVKYGYRAISGHHFVDMINVCKEYDVPVFMKQMGTYLAKTYMLTDNHGGNIDEWPSENLKVREMPLIV
jgi:protein gp37